MITTGIIREINISDGNYSNNEYRVELPIFNNPSNTNAEGCIMTCTASLPGGHYSSYYVGDMVYVGFVNNDISHPVILGRIYKGLTGETRGYEQLDGLRVDGTVELPKTIKIGDLSYDDLKYSFNLANKMPTITANPTGSTTGTLTSIEISGINYAIDGGSEALIDDVRLNGTSVVTDRIANIPYNLSSYNDDVGYVTLGTEQTIIALKKFDVTPTVKKIHHKGTHELSSDYIELQYVTSPGGVNITCTGLSWDSSTQYAYVKAVPNGFTGSYGTLFGTNSAPQIGYNATQWYVGDAGGTKAGSPVYGTVYEITYSKEAQYQLWVDGVYTGVSRSGTSSPVHIFSNGASDIAIASIYIIEVRSRDDDSLIYQFIPCKQKSTSYVGFYETVTGVFFGNTSIVAGPEDEGGESYTTYDEVLTEADISIPTKVSQLENDKGYITSSAIGNGTLTIQKNGTTVNTFTANSSSSKTVNITVPDAQIQSDWTQTDTTKLDYIKNKPDASSITSEILTLGW